MIWFAIGAGGALGAMARHGLTLAVQARYSGFPIQIFMVNVLGCLAIGLFAGMIASGRVEVGEVGRAFVVVGVLGGFTTFSSFGLDTFVLAKSGQHALALLNAAGQVVVGLAVLWLGYVVGSWRP